jgi:hypothetical protein
MQTADDKEFHVARARAELDAAYRAERSEVAAAHLKLSALHMRRAQQLVVQSDMELSWIERCAPLHHVRAAIGQEA